MRADVPLLLVTCTSTVPAASAGETAVIVPFELMEYEAAGTDPKRTPVTLDNWLPEIVIVVPPEVGPLDVLNPLIDGAGFVKVN